jgi:hypothetical protein
MKMQNTLQELADTLVLGALLDELRARFGPYELVEHWKQGEFHHDLVVRVAGRAVDARDACGLEDEVGHARGIEAPRGTGLPDEAIFVATNCNGGVKELLAFAEVPSRSALWHLRCPDVAEFVGDLPTIKGRAITAHWFDPCDLLRPDARSELRAEFRRRQHGGGWEADSVPCGSRGSPQGNERVP